MNQNISMKRSLPHLSDGICFKLLICFFLVMKMTSIFCACLLNWCVLVCMLAFLFINNPAVWTEFIHSLRPSLSIALSDPGSFSFIFCTVLFCVHVTYKLKGLYLFQTTRFSVIKQNAGLLLFSEFVQVHQTDRGYLQSDQQLNFYSIFMYCILSSFVYSFHFCSGTPTISHLAEMMRGIVTQPSRVQSGAFLFILSHPQQQYYLERSAWIRYSVSGIGDLYFVIIISI